MTKVKEQIEPLDLTGMSDDELYHIGECFAKDLKKLIDAYGPYFMQHNFFRMLCDIFNKIEAELKKEERVVE